LKQKYANLSPDQFKWFTKYICILIIESLCPWVQKESI